MHTSYLGREKRRKIMGGRKERERERRKVVNIRDEREDLTTDSIGKVNKGIVE